VANFIEQSRPDSPAFLPNMKEPTYIETFVREVEFASTALITAFHMAPPRRPAWAGFDEQR